jgi:hypothetical protein
MRNQIRRGQPRTRGFQSRRRHARRKLHAQIHQRAERTLQEIAQPIRTKHIGDLVWVADGGSGTVRQHAAIEFSSRDQGDGRLDDGVRLAVFTLRALRLLGNGLSVLCGASRHLEFAVVTSQQR